VWDVAAHWNLSVVCLICLSEGVSKLSSAMFLFEQIFNMYKLGKSAAEMLQALHTTDEMGLCKVCFVISDLRSKGVLEDNCK
jgi:hypothetical protein